MIRKLLLVAMISLTSFASEMIINETKKLEKKSSLTRDNAKSVVTDSDTGMMWKDDYQTKKVWSEAVEYCKSLTLGGFNDWHLPTISELESIADYTEHKPAIKSGFDNVTSHIYWSATVDASDVNEAWFVLFENGRSYTLDKKNKANVKCVRAVQNKTSDIKRDGDVVTDNGTTTVWQDSSETASLLHNYEESVKYCKDLSLGGKDDWYLPTIEQLLTITDKTTSNPSIKKEFKNTVSDAYWSSTIHPSHPDRVWFVHFGYGFSSDYGNKETKRSTRCARAGNSHSVSFVNLISELVEKEMNTIPKPTTMEHLEERVLRKSLESKWGKPNLVNLKYKGRKGYFVADLLFEGNPDFNEKVFIKMDRKNHIKFKRAFKTLKPEAVFVYDGNSIMLKEVRVVYNEKSYSMDFEEMKVEDTKVDVKIGNGIKF